MQKRGQIIIAIIALIIVIGAGIIILIYKDSGPTCQQWMGDALAKNSLFKTSEEVLEACDDRSFKELNYEYAKDNNYVYFKPMPNAYNMAVRLEQADAGSFELLKRCPGYALDKQYVYRDGEIVEGKNPEGQMYGKKRTRKVVESAFGRGEEHMVNAIVKDFLAFNGDKPLDDDLTLVAAQLTPEAFP